LKKNILPFLLAFSCTALVAQNDSTLMLKPERLSERDIDSLVRLDARARVVVGTRSPEVAEGLPFEIRVITAEEILRHGYVTLGDVMRSLPDVRVSQPGNAYEGETFLMRGLAGNQYVKILINDVPVKPSTALGMPIGAQLPIRQAERIEVLYGPAGSIYGGEACAGVVNIVLKESERPVFTQADLGFGNYGYNSLDLMFGGRLGKDNRIFRFSLYGSSTVRERTDLFWEPELFKTGNYLPFGLDSSIYRANPNFRYAGGSDSSLAKTAPVAHESRLFGINLTWRGLHLTYHRMLRRDHSALGLNPLAISWANPANRLSEQLETFSLGLSRSRKRRISHNTLSVVAYRIDNTATASYVFDPLTAAAYGLQAPLAATDSARQAIRQRLFDQLSRGERYLAANGADLRYESRLRVNYSRTFSFDAGAQFNLGGGFPINGYYTTPAEEGIPGVTETVVNGPFVFDPRVNLDLNLFTQVDWRPGKWRFIAGTAGNLAFDNSPEIAPRLGVFYRLDSTWSIRASYAAGFRRPPIFAQANSYRINRYTGDISLYTNGPGTTERFNSYEGGVQYQKRGTSVAGSIFHQTASWMARPGYLIPEDSAPGQDSFWLYGWENAPGRALEMSGIKGGIVLRSARLPLKINGRDRDIYTQIEYHFQYVWGREWFGYGLEPAADVRNQPPWMAQFRFSLRNEKFQFMLASSRQTSALHKAVTYRDLFQRQRIEERSDKFRTWDIMFRAYLSTYFALYLNVQNLFDRHYAGLDATGTQADLLFNPQPGRLVRLGINYNMNLRR
jgi:outer membrane receptor protein involved in Fe transport